jgi:hypothetical protein
MDRLDEIMLKAIEEKIKKGLPLTPQEEDLYNSLKEENIASSKQK